jgi:hypothetical protein
MKRAMAALLLALSGCGGDELLNAQFTSQIVQLETCRTVGTGEEGCTRNEQFAERRLDLVEVEADVFWLYGVVRDGATDRALLGARDTAGGFYFVDERTTTNSETGCVQVARIEVSLKVEDDRAADVGVDPCVSLVGRSIDTISLSAACDTTNLPAQPVVQTVRRRYEALDASSTCGE